MANQLDLTSVLYINNNPVKVAESYSLLTSDILIYEIDNPLYPGINSATQYYGNTSNQLAYTTYYSTSTVSSLLAAANVGVASLVQVPVKSINSVPFSTQLDFLFPANGIQLREVSNNVTEIYFKGNYYLTDTPIGSIIAQANTGGGGGGGTNPTNLFIPYNDAGTFEDSYIKNDTTVGAETLSTIIGGDAKGFELEFWDGFYQFGDFDWVDNGTSLLIDDAASVIKSFYQGNDIGLKMDFSTKEYKIGDYDNTNTGTALIMEDDTNKVLKSVYGGSDVGLNLDFLNQEYKIGDYNNINNGVALVLDDTNSIFKTLYGGVNAGLYFEPMIGMFQFGYFDTS